MFSGAENTRASPADKPRRYRSVKPGGSSIRPRLRSIIRQPEAGQAESGGQARLAGAKLFLTVFAVTGFHWDARSARRFAGRLVFPGLS